MFHRTKIILISFFLFIIGILLIPQTTSSDNNTTIYKVGVLWVGQAAMQDRIMQGFLSTMTITAPQIDIEIAKELKTFDEGIEIFKKFENEKDAVIFLRSSGCEFFKTYTPKKPSFCGGCSDPVSLGTVKNMESPEGMVTGVTYALPYDTHINILMRVLPQITRLCLLLEKDHPGSIIDREGTQKICQKKGIHYNEILAEDLTSLQEKIAAIRDQVDVFIIGQQSLIMDNTKDIVNAAGDTPVASYSAKSVASGALIAIAVDDIKLGSELAKSVIDVLIHKKSIKDVPFKTDKNPQIFFNLTASGKYNVLAPVDILRNAEIID